MMNGSEYIEYDESGEMVRVSGDAGYLIADTREFGGCVTDQDGNFVGGSEWVFNDVLNGGAR